MNTVVGCESCGGTDKREDDIGFYDGWYHKECWVKEDIKMRPRLYKGDEKYETSIGI